MAPHLSVDSVTSDRVDICVRGRITLHFVRNPITRSGVECKDRTIHNGCHGTGVSEDDFIEAETTAINELLRAKDLIDPDEISEDERELQYA